MKKLTIRLTDDVSAALTALAQTHQRSVNRQVVWLIEQALKDAPRLDAKGSEESKESDRR